MKFPRRPTDTQSVIPASSQPTVHPCTSRFRAPADLESLRFFRGALAALIDRRGTCATRSGDMLLALSEAVTNAIEHGSRLGDEVEVIITWDATSALLQVVDHGSGAAPLITRGAPPAPPATALRGRGLVIIHAVADTVAAEAVGGGTRLSMVFHHPVLAAA